MYQTIRRACCWCWASATTRSKWSSLLIGSRWRDETGSSSCNWPSSCLNGIDEGDERETEIDGKVKRHGERVVDVGDGVVAVKKNVDAGWEWGWRWDPTCCAICLLTVAEAKCPNHTAFITCVLDVYLCKTSRIDFSLPF